MADDVLTAPDIKERAYKKAIKLIQASGDAGPDGYEYTTYQFLLESYSAQKNPEKYLATLNEMIDRFGSNEELEGYKRHVEDVIAQQKQAAVQDAYAQADTYTEPKPEAAEPVKESTQTVEPKQVAKPKKIAEPVVESQPAPTSDNTMLWWLLGGGIGLLGVIVLLLRRKKA